MVKLSNPGHSQHHSKYIVKNAVENGLYQPLIIMLIGDDDHINNADDDGGVGMMIMLIGDDDHINNLDDD